MIYINGRFLSQKLTGVNRVAYELCNALFLLKVEFVIIAPRKILIEYDISNFNIIYWGIGKSHFWDQLSLPFFFLLKKKYLLINFSGLGTLLLKKQFLTIHDMSFWRHPEWFSKIYFYYYKALTPIVARRALHILTVSEFSRKEIIDCLKVDESKVSVVYNAVSQQFINKNINIKNESKTVEYILAVSSIDPRKNFLRLLSAVNLLDTKVKLVIIGNSNSVFQNIDLNYSERVNFLGHVSDDQLRMYYSNAKLFVYPSVYEGFGLPPLEAMAMSCPTVVSDIKVFNEVFGDATKYFDPYDVDDIARCINQVLKSKEIQEELISKGLELVNKYSWQNSAQKLVHIIEKIRL